jgi:hypothetical protein
MGFERVTGCEATGYCELPLVPSASAATKLGRKPSISFDWADGLNTSL